MKIDSLFLMYHKVHEIIIEEEVQIIIFFY